MREVSPEGKPPLRSSYRPLVALIFGLFAAIIAYSASRAEGAAAKSPGAVYLFSGLVWPIFDSTRGTGAEAMMQKIQALGVHAEVDRPDDWEKAANAFVALAQPSMPVAVVGYSLGANAAILFSRRLEQLGVPVQTLVLIEAAKPAPIPANVRRAVHYYVSGMADPISPGPGFSGSIANVDLAKIDPDAARLNHWSVSHFDFLHSKVVAEVLDRDRVRMRGEGAKKALEAGKKK